MAASQISPIVLPLAVAHTAVYLGAGGGTPDQDHEVAQAAVDAI
ncbi:MAG: hypothetical protein ACRDZO_18305 [Egibacteraceae bacterium]